MPLDFQLHWPFWWFYHRDYHSCKSSGEFLKVFLTNIKKNPINIKYAQSRLNLNHLPPKGRHHSNLLPIQVALVWGATWKAARRMQHWNRSPWASNGLAVLWKYPETSDSPERTQWPAVRNNNTFTLTINPKHLTEPKFGLFLLGQAEKPVFVSPNLSSDTQKKDKKHLLTMRMAALL